MEQQSGGGGWEMVAVPPKPGEMRLWAYQSVAHGADAIIYFRWRTCRTGTEQYWHGVLDHHGIPGRRYDEAAKMGSELQKIGEIIEGSQIKSRIAIMQSYDTRFAFQVQPNNPRFGYESHIQDVYRGFYNRNVPVDIISEKGDLNGFKVVIVPAMYVLSEETATNLEIFSAEGGIVVFTPRTGVKDIDNKVVNLKLPGLVAKMAGVEVEEYVSLPEDEDSKVHFTLPNLEEEFTASVWADVLKPTTARVAARYSQDYYANQAAVTMNTFGDGKVIYIGTMGDAGFYQSITEWVLGLANLEPLLDVPPGVEITERWNGSQQLLFILNHNTSVCEISLPDKYKDIISEKNVNGDISIAPYDVLVLANLERS
jgi:beta-galactosidase